MFIPLQKHSWRNARIALVLIAGLALLGVNLRGQTITNASFEATSFTVSPGYVSGNSPIPGWFANDNTKVGLSLFGAASPFVNNGSIPNGTNAAFIQSGAAGGTILSNMISGLTPGQLYKVNFRVNARTNASVAASTPNLKVGVSGTPIVDTSVFCVAAVSNATAWRFFAIDFLASASTHVLTLKNDTVADTTVLVDDFSIAPSTGSWTITRWTNDLSSGVNSTNVFTHAYNFNSASSPVISNVTFTAMGSGNINPAVAGRFTTGGLGQQTTDPANALVTAGGGSATLANAFDYNGNPATITIFGLVPGVEYVASIYSVGWTETIRPITFSVGTDRLTVNQDHFGTDIGIIVNYRYIAPAAGYITITYTPLMTNPLNSFHTYGFSNYENTKTPTIGVQPRSQVAAIGTTSTLRVRAGGGASLGYQWQKGGVSVSSATNTFLNIPVTSSNDAGAYTVIITNSAGNAVTSSVANVTIGTIANPSFEADTFFGFPGYIGQATPNPANNIISGWAVSDTNRAGLNPIADAQSPFANNGVIPDGSQAAFLQSTSVITTTISSLISNQTYTLQFRANARSVYLPLLHAAINGQSVLDMRYSNVGGTNGYRFIAFDFTAANTNAILSLTNDTVGDHTVNIDNFTIAPSTNKWSIAAWNDDASSGVDNSKLYTHAYRFNNAASTVINGITFNGVAGFTPSVAGSFSTGGYGSGTTDPGNVLITAGGGSATLASAFIYGGATQSITMSNLIPGIEYLATIYSVGWDVRSYGRSATFNVGTDRMTINQDHFGNDVGIRISYRYFADASGTITLTYTASDAASTIHTYGFANAQLTVLAPVVAVQPAAQFVPGGGNLNLSVTLSAGTPPIHYQWQSNGVDILDQTNSTLSFSNITADVAANYQVVITNSVGSITSNIAAVEVGTAFSELFNTGMDNSRTLLASNSVDPHYVLIQSGDINFPGPSALVMADAYPIPPYLTNGPNSKWLAPSLNTNGYPGNSAGFYTYRTTFIIDTADATRAQLGGRWSSDNEGVAILLNGALTGVSNMISGGFSTFYPFTITNGFVAGSNVIDFVISNGPASGPTGFRAELIGVGRTLSNTPPVIANQPTSRNVLENGNAVFSAVATGSGPLSYQWYYYGFFPLTDETNRTLRLNNVSIDQAGDYSVVVTSPAGSTNSDTATLTVLVPPTITDGPVTPQTVECGGTASFSVTLRPETTTPVTYQWYFGVSPITTGTNSTLTLTPVSTAQSGGYRVIVSNAGGSVTSVVASLTVQDTTAPVITLLGTSPVTVECHSLYTDAGATASDLCSGDLTGSIIVTGTVNTNVPGTYILHYNVSDGSLNAAVEVTRTVNVVDTTAPALTCNSNILVVALSTNATNLTYASTATDACDGSPNLVCTPASGSAFEMGVTTVNCTTWDAALNTNTCSFTVTVLVAPIITQQPESRTNNLGTTATFTVAADGTAPLSYQWYFNLTNVITDATNTTLTLTNVASTDAGNYTVVVTNIAGSVTSAIATLTVGDTTPPVITCSTNRLVECAGPGGTSVSFVVTATDNSDPSPTVVCTPASGSLFSTGNTTVNCYAYDVSLNTNTCSFTVTVQDTTAPTINCSTNRVVHTIHAGGTNVTYAVSAGDTCDAAPGVVCVPASGSLFAPGTTTVNCTATDAAGNTNTCSFTVSVTVLVAPTITDAGITGSDFHLSFATVAGLTYTVQYADTIDGSVGGEGITWNTLTTVTGDGTVKTVHDTGASGLKRFYRVNVQ